MKFARSLIGKTLLLFVLLMASYEGLVRQLPTGWLIGQNQFQRNVVVAERFVDAPASQKPGVVILGSSLAFRLGDYYRLPPMPGVTMLAFGGSTAFDGMELIRQTGRYPDTALLEINLPYTHKPNATLLGAVLGPPKFPLRKYLYSLKTLTQPSNVVLQGGYMLLKSAQSPVDWDTPPTEPAGVRDAAIFAQSMLGVYREKSRIPQRPFMDSYLKAISRMVSDLQQQGSTVIAFRMPIEAEVESYPSQVEIYREISQHLQQNHGLTVLSFASKNVSTMDGLHLDKASALLVRQQLLQYIRSH